MRIIGGQFKGRRINPPANKWPTRPTTDFAREALFNILNNTLDWQDTRMLDLFGGTGLVSIEAISRGCCDITYVDRYGPCVKFVKSQSEALGITSELIILRRDVFSYIKSFAGESFDLIFADPPYLLKEIESLPDLIFDMGMLSKDGLLVIEHGPQTSLEDNIRYSHSRNYGSSVFSFFA
jgi:16S rRNA (guanine(966)-N(2))-methyltransferase RsmD